MHCGRPLFKNFPEKAGAKCGPTVGYFVKDVRILRGEACNLLNPSMLLFMTLRAEHRLSGLYVILKHGQSHANSAMDAEPFIQDMVHKMAAARVVAGAFRGLAYFSKTLLEYLDESPPAPKKPCGIPRNKRPSKIQVRAFLTVLAWHAAGRYGFACSCNYFLEILFDRTFLGLQCGLRRVDAHPFSEPLTREKKEALHGAPRGEGLKRCLEILTVSTQRFEEWSKRESLYFRTRVAFWCSDHPMEDLVGSVRRGTAREAQDNVQELPEISADACDAALEVPADTQLHDPLASILECIPVLALEDGGDSVPLDGEPAEDSCELETDPGRVSDSKPRAWKRGVTIFMCKKTRRVLATNTNAYHQRHWSVLRVGGFCGPIHGRWYEVALRKQVASLAAVFFSSRVLLGSDPVNEGDLNAAMGVLAEVFGPMLWGLPRVAVHWDDPPDEMLQSVTAQELGFQWRRLRCLVQVMRGRSPTLADYDSDDVPNCLLLGVALQVNYSKIQQHGVWHVLALWHRLALATLRSSMLNEHIGSVLRKMERQDGAPSSSATLIRASRLRIAGFRGSVLESAFVLQVLRKVNAERKKVKRFHFFVSDRSAQRRARTECCTYGPSVVLARLREGGVPASLTHPTLPLFPWVYEGWTVRKTRDYAQKLDFQALRHSSVILESHYDPSACDDLAEVIPLLHILGIDPEKPS